MSRLTWADEEKTETEPIGEIIVSAETIPSDTLPEKPTSFCEIIDIREINHRFLELKEILSGKVGIHVRRFGGFEASSSVSIRGVSSKGVLVLIDDVPLNGIGSTGVDLSTLPLVGFDKIEIFRGGGGAFYGDSALGGAINLVTSGADKKINHSSLSLGSFGLISAKSLFSSRNGKEDILFALESTGSRGDFSFLNDNGTSLDKSDDFPDKRKNNESEATGGLFKVSTESDNHVKTSVVSEFYHSRKGIPGLVTFPTPDARQVDKRVFVQALIEKENVAPLINGVFRMFFRHDGLDYEDKLGQGTGSPIDTHRADNLFGVATKMTRIDPDGFGSLQMELELADDRYQLKGDSNRGRSRFSFSLSKDRTSKDNRLTFQGAGRIDAIEGFSPRATFRMGASLQSSQNIEFRANIGNSFRTPGFDELFDNRGFIIGNHNLVPEKGYDMDCGVLYRNKNSYLGFSLFHNRLKDQIVYELTSGHRFKPFNVGKSNLSGIEISAERKFDDLSISGNYTFLDARNKSDDALTFNKQLPSRPKHELFVSAAYDKYPFVIASDLNYSSGNYVTFANTTRLKSRFCADLRTIYSNNNWSFTAEVRNLFDNNLVDIRGFPLPGRFYIFTISKDF